MCQTWDVFFFSNLVCYSVSVRVPAPLVDHRRLELGRERLLRDSLLCSSSQVPPKVPSQILTMKSHYKYVADENVIRQIFVVTTKRL